jgi:hypothetical protein
MHIWPMGHDSLAHPWCVNPPDRKKKACRRKYRAREHNGRRTDAQPGRPRAIDLCHSILRPTRGPGYQVPAVATPGAAILSRSVGATGSINSTLPRLPCATFLRGDRRGNKHPLVVVAAALIESQRGRWTTTHDAHNATTPIGNN